MTQIWPSANSYRWKRYRESDDRKHHETTSVSLLDGGGSIAGGLDDPANASSLDDSRRDFEALKTRMARDNAELENLKAELDVETGKGEKEEEKVGKAKTEKEELEAELQSLSRALFEEANNMAATECKLRAETESKLQRQQQDLKDVVTWMEVLLTLTLFYVGMLFNHSKYRSQTSLAMKDTYQSRNTVPYPSIHDVHDVHPICNVIDVCCAWDAWNSLAVRVKHHRSRH
ncbi:hypothetical protein F5879DRAFT_925397 [Lentinula edodes]|nr:hypothetical protein F5879DRAFT_925397 [Lentinula edodes]